MEYEWKQAAKTLDSITVTSQENNEPVIVEGQTDDLRCVGVGTDAAVFQSIQAPAYAFKLFARDKQLKIKTEAEVYQSLGPSSYFPDFYGAEERCLVLSYEDGTTFYDCLLQGIPIPEQAVKDIEHARCYVKQRGLNPRDIHLRNMLLQHGRGKLIDVSEYALPGNDYRFEHLKQAYDEYYPLIKGRPVPFWLAEVVRKWYNQRSDHFSSYDEFLQKVKKLFLFKKEHTR
ncbi:hypothetical protein SAMN05192534_10318 [Alteribacillus persepolensis]|uniref:Serine/threonine protein kinase n=1 Tax=Alteribacillus persepolensis TaxID=568899 RepID=A0A1G8AU07_9BACI|nr:serine/threonine protein kinase [Alteribacillus persepolensis]SDH24448.1 hypothetical protein SAMN05192534_10318 [Alteribacillus persepolensis]